MITDLGRDIDGLEYSMATDVDAQETVRLVEEAGRRSLALVADVRDPDALDEAVATSIETFGQLDILVSNAGIIDLKPFWEISEDEWSTVVDVNLSGAWRSAKAVAAHMRGAVLGIDRLQLLPERRSGSLEPTRTTSLPSMGFLA